MADNINKQVSDEIMNFNSQLPRIEADMARKTNARLKQLEATLIRQLTEIDPSAPTRAAYKTRRLQELLKKVQKDIADVYRAIKIEVGNNNVSVAQLSATATTKGINDSVGIVLATRSISADAIKRIVFEDVIEGAKSADWWARQAGSLKFRFQRQIGEAIQLNETLQDMVRRIRGTKANNFKDGIMSLSKREAEGLIRTSTINAANGSRMETLHANDDIIEGIEWISTLDGSTTAICAALDGLVWNLDYKPIGHKQQYPGNTAHWGCRSGQAPVIKEYDDIPKNKRVKIPEGTRASMDGQVSDKETYDSWLRKKNSTNPAFVKETLGKRKYEIWKDNRLSTRDMVDQYNNPLSVAELEKRYT
jgi:SPP1 gp7 family putative phage head morphogenesis protein